MFEVQKAVLVSFIYVIMCYKVCICIHIFSVSLVQPWLALNFLHTAEDDLV